MILLELIYECQDARVLHLADKTMYYIVMMILKISHGI